MITLTQDPRIGRCPYCRAIPSIAEEEGLYPKFYVQCDCGLRSITTDYPSDARHMWNTMRGIVWGTQTTVWQ